jgi:hypothetical protein
VAVEILRRAAGKPDECFRRNTCRSGVCRYQDLPGIWKSMEPAARANPITGIRQHDSMRMLRNWLLR